MNRLNLFIVVILITFASPLFAIDYLIEDGDEFGNLTLIEHDSLIMTGGGGQGSKPGFEGGFEAVLSLV